MSIQWHIQPDGVVGAEALADAVAAALQQVLAQKGSAVLAVSGGRSPIAFFKALSQKTLDWDKISVTLVDERLVPVNHADSNTGLVREYLLQNRAQAAKWLPLVGDDADEAALADTAQTVVEALQHFRQPDVLVLGMGGDGHTASLFPQAPQLAQGLDSHAGLLLHTTPVTAPYERISMTLAAIENTAHVFLAIAGTEKKAVLQQAQAAVNQTYPISYVIHSEKVATHVFYNE
mgnify:CR=1 FL=1